MKKTKSTPKLRLNRETIRELTGAQATMVVGARRFDYTLSGGGTLPETICLGSICAATYEPCC